MADNDYIRVLRRADGAIFTWTAALAGRPGFKEYLQHRETKVLQAPVDPNLTTESPIQASGLLHQEQGQSADPDPEPEQAASAADTDPEETDPEPASDDLYQADMLSTKAELLQFGAKLGVELNPRQTVSALRDRLRQLEREAANK